MAAITGLFKTRFEAAWCADSQEGFQFWTGLSTKKGGLFSPLFLCVFNYYRIDFYYQLPCAPPIVFVYAVPLGQRPESSVTEMVVTPPPSVMVMLV
jgi:hypothetical protein